MDKYCIFLLILFVCDAAPEEETSTTLESFHLNSDTTPSCELKETFLGSKKIYTCTNVSGSYLESHSHHTNRSEWFHCSQCTLATLTERTLHRFEPKNRILYLNVSACRVDAIADFAFREIPNLKLLLLRDNNLTNLTSATFHSLRRLLQLDLSRNQLEELVDDTFVHLGVLDILNLNFNRLRTLQPRAFAGMKELKYLYLSYNRIGNVHPYLFKDLINLRILYVEYNQIKEISPLAFTNLQRLQYLYLNHNTIEFLSEYNFKELGELVDLQMRGNALNEICTSAFNGLRKLKFLYLGDNNISTLAQHSFTGLDSLTILDLTNNSLSSFSLEFLVDMPELRGLWLENNRIEALPIARSNKTHRNLASFDLKQNRLDYFNYKMLLKQLECLEEIYVGENRFKCEFFMPMYDYFEESNVTLCLDARCDKNNTVWYTEKLCRLSYNAQPDDNANVDEVLNGGDTTGRSFYMHLTHLIYCLVFVRVFVGK
ncbi:insulin-like growth factor-binding protein complex acid labile subunit [Atheta coriaria]|uniref:insulin-like growth factor-binding protein complex acid labile subunit n=1 Tax=Dalotia coriaria TaxID=877792 RepID=UPI0031F38936